MRSRNKWIRRFHRFRRLPWKIKILLFISFFATGAARLLLVIIPFKRLVPLLGQASADSPYQLDQRTIRKAAIIGWSVETTSRFTPWESKCLVRAMVAQSLLRVLHIPGTLYLGVAKDQSTQLIAHAWVRSGPLYLTGAEEKDKFRQVAQFSIFQGQQETYDSSQSG